MWGSSLYPIFRSTGGVFHYKDVNGDGVVNGSDVQAVATHFGPCP
ncbi:MAG: hypothetical protein ACYSXF_11405 [Planctomycetota bacterium]|jgi:hypothetical protein